MHKESQKDLRTWFSGRETSKPDNAQIYHNLLIIMIIFMVIIIIKRVLMDVDSEVSSCRRIVMWSDYYLARRQNAPMDRRLVNFIDVGDLSGSLDKWGISGVFL